MRRSRVVLLVDPQDERRVTFQVVLKREGYGVLEATDAAEALATARETEPELVVVHMGLPRSTGAQLLRLLRAEHGDGLRLLGMGAASFQAEAVAAGANESLVEPVAPDHLVRSVIALIGRA